MSLFVNQGQGQMVCMRPWHYASGGTILTFGAAVDTGAILWC